MGSMAAKCTYLSYTGSGAYFNHEPRRTRKLLLHRQEIRKLIGKVEQQGLTLVPLRMYLKRGLVKVSIALGKGKTLRQARRPEAPPRQA
jgi:SsrA-binding protein